MKVYIISANWGCGGPGGIAKDLYNTLTENGHFVRFGYSRETIPPQINSFKFGTKSGVYIHAGLTRIFDKGGFYSRFDTKKLIKDIKNFQPDIISIHNPLGYTLNLPLLMDFVNNEGIPSFYTLHDTWMITGHCICMICDRLEKGCGHCPNKREFPSSLIFDHSKQNLKYKQTHFNKIKNLQFISCSKWINNLANNSYLRNYKNTIINNGIDLSIFKPTQSDFRSKYNLENQVVILGVAGIWSKWKGQQYFKELVKYLHKYWKIVLVGKGLDKDIKSCKEIISIDATNNIEELAKIYSSADVFVNPTIGDNYPTVNLEAIACGTPVVTFNTGGSGEMIGECGKIVEQGNVEQLYSAVNEIINNPIDRNICVEHAKNFDKRKKFAEYIDLFESNINRLNK